MKRNYLIKCKRKTAEDVIKINSSLTCAVQTRVRNSAAKTSTFTRRFLFLQFLRAHVDKYYFLLRARVIITVVNLFRFIYTMADSIPSGCSWDDIILGSLLYAFWFFGLEYHSTSSSPEKRLSGVWCWRVRSTLIRCVCCGAVFWGAAGTVSDSALLVGGLHAGTSVPK